MGVDNDTSSRRLRPFEYVIALLGAKGAAGLLWVVAYGALLFATPVPFAPPVLVNIIATIAAVYVAIRAAAHHIWYFMDWHVPVRLMVGVMAGLVVLFFARNLGDAGSSADMVLNVAYNLAAGAVGLLLMAKILRPNLMRNPVPCKCGLTHDSWDSGELGWLFGLLRGGRR